MARDENGRRPRWREITFAVPDLASFGDADLDRHFTERDGAWSAATKAALARFGVDRLDLDENWASVWPDWECPGCGRRKAELFRLTGNDVLLARLDIHHDHLGDILKARLRDAIGSDWISWIAPGVAHFEKLSSKMLVRFAPTLVCLDCNVADGTVKKRSPDIPRDFSFRPSEIRRFITPVANGEHGVDVKAALQIFEAERIDFEKRVHFLDTIFAIIANGEMPQERGNLPPAGVPRPLGMLGYLHSAVLRSDREGYSAVSKDLDAFAMRSVSRAGVASNPAKRWRRAVKIPSPEEIATHDGGGAADLWNAVGADWRCPACDRAKAEIIRSSNNPRRKWSGKLLRHTEFTVKDGYDEDDEYGEWIDHHEIMLICGDCANILPAVKQREPNLSRSDVLFQLRDMRAVTIAAPHQPHEVDWEMAMRLARESSALHALTVPYWDHYFAAVNCRARYRDYLKYCRGNADRAWNRLMVEYREEGIDPTEVEEHVALLLAEADRIGVEDPYRQKPDHLYNASLT